MLTIFNAESLWIGVDLKRFDQIRDILEQEGIVYKYKVIDHSGEWTGRGSIRGNMGSGDCFAGLNKQYEIFVKKKDFERAKMII